MGIGGAYAGSGLQIGDLAVASAEHDAELGVVTPDGWQGAERIGIPVVERDGVSYFNQFPVDAALSKRVAGAVGAARGPFLSVQSCSGTADLGARRAARVAGALCENMEGAAAAQVCLRHGGIPFVELRAISNHVEDRDTSRWDLPGACRRAQDAARIALKELTC